MNDLQRRLDDLRRQLQDGDATNLPELERTARALLSDSKNTPYESAAQALFAEIARMGVRPRDTGTTRAIEGATPSDATVRGLVRRARIRLEIAGDDDDVDEAIDILAQALTINAQDNDTLNLLRDAAARSDQATQRVNDLFKRYGVNETMRKTNEIDAVRPQSADGAKTADDEPKPRKRKPKNADYPTSSGYPAPEQEMGRRVPGRGPLNVGPDIDEMLSELTQAYYAGDYQRSVELANRILSQQPSNVTALDYRQKSEDNLIRGVVPDHRIPFDARVAYNRANSLVRAGNYDDAEKLYREARDLAGRSGILNWKDAEQALLEIQDLALARELLNEGDRLVASDSWADAIRKYEGALRVVANDPVGQERVETIRRVQQDTDQALVQLSMLGGSLPEQVTQLQNVLGILARVRQLLPNSKRLAQITQDANNRLNAIKAQLKDQAQAAFTRAKNTTSVEERLHMTSEALKMLEMGVELDPGDTELSTMLLEARSSSSDMQRARQVIERSAALIAQNFDNELSQARSMLAGLVDYAQDDRYRAVVSDLLARYIERAEFAIEDGDLAEAQTWIDTVKEEPFRILGRRTEVARVENNLRQQRQGSRLRWLAIIGGIILIVGAIAAVSSPVWMPVLITPTPTTTLTPSITPIPSDTPTATATFTPSNTATWTITPSPTVTPSWTVTASLTPTATATATETPTATATFTPSNTPTPTDTPTITATPAVLCEVRSSTGQSINVRVEPSTSANRVAVAEADEVLNVVEAQVGADGITWYRVRLETFSGTGFQGWVRSDAVNETTQSQPCPNLTPP
jgi:tetratricopeptide (TPR) repeat protein